MTELTLWRKQEIDKLRRDIDLLFRRFRRDFGLPRSLFEAAESFSMELSETENTLTIKAALPGINPDDIQISVTDDTLTLKGKLKEDIVEKSDTYQRVEERSRTFSRSISLPCRIMPQEVKATYNEGMLQIDLPKCRPEKARGVTIEVK